jgi:FG-GAP repeat
MNPGSPLRLFALMVAWRMAAVGTMADPLPLLPRLDQQLQLETGDRMAGDFFGRSLAADGETVIVGSCGEDRVGWSGSMGSAYIFVRNGDHWEVQAKLRGSDQNLSDSRFGIAVALDGDTAVVGASYQESFNGNQTGTFGAAYVFVRQGTQWTEQAKLTAVTEGSWYAGFGRAVAISGDTIVIGAPGAEKHTESGRVEVFVRRGNTWTIQAVLPGALGFGFAVAIEGDTLLAASPGTPTSEQYDRGSVHVFVRNGSMWTQQSELRTAKSKAPGGYGGFGYSVALSGGTAVAGTAPLDAQTTLIGHAHVFEGAGESWTQTASLTASDATPADSFGGSVAIRGDRISVGAPWKGRSYVFARTAGAWSEEGILLPVEASHVPWGFMGVALTGDTVFSSAIDVPVTAFRKQAGEWITDSSFATDPVSQRQFGHRMAVNGDTALIGSAGGGHVFVREAGTWNPQTTLVPSTGLSSSFTWGDYGAALDGDTAVLSVLSDSTGAGGEAWVFVRSGFTWTEQARLTAPHLFRSRTLAISGDTVVIGLSQPNARADRAWVYVRTGTTWAREAEIILEDGTVQFDSLALHGDTLLLGAPFADTSEGQDSGCAYVFTRTGSVWTQEAKIVPDGGGANHWFGMAAAYDGNRAVIGGYWGASYADVYHREGTDWVREARFSWAPHSNFGESVAIEGDRVAIGASSSGTGGTAAALVFEKRSGTWCGPLVVASSYQGPDAGDGLARTVALSGDQVLVAASGQRQINPLDGIEMRNQGAVRVYRLADTTGWSGIQSWRYLLFGSAENAGSGHDAADFDLDGQNNLLEFAFGSDPLSPDGFSMPPVTDPRRQLQFPALPYDAAGLTYEVRTSTDLQTWTTIATASPGAANQPGPLVMLPPPQSPKEFLSVRVHPGNQ